MSMSVLSNLCENQSNIKSTSKICWQGQIGNDILRKWYLMSLLHWSIHMKNRMNRNRKRQMSSCWLVCKEQERLLLVQRFTPYTATALMGIVGVILSAERVQVMSGLCGHIPCRSVRSIETECN